MSGAHLPVVAVEVEVHALAEGNRAEQRAVHPDHLGALRLAEAPMAGLLLGCELGCELGCVY